MNSPLLRLTGPSRLHFGLLAWGKEAPRQFGSVGLMVDRPGLSIVAQPAPTWEARGPLAQRVREVIRRVVHQLEQEAISISSMELTVEAAPPEHVGLGTGTQISLAVAKLLLHSLGETAPSISRLAHLTGRGLRSGIGLHGFVQGGLIVDGGRAAHSDYPPILARIELPSDWSVLIVVPEVGEGLSSAREHKAFAQLPGLSITTIDRLCRLVLLGILPAAAEGDLSAFGASLTEIQNLVGQCFAPVQGGIFANAKSEAILKAMTEIGLLGVGQSSWGPALYGFLATDEAEKTRIVERLMDCFSLPAQACIWAGCAPTGAKVIAG